MGRARLIRAHFRDWQSTPEGFDRVREWLRSVEREHVVLRPGVTVREENGQVYAIARVREREGGRGA